MDRIDREILDNVLIEVESTDNLRDKNLIQWLVYSLQDAYDVLDRVADGQKALQELIKE